MNTNIYGNFQFCISVPLNRAFCKINYICLEYYIQKLFTFFTNKINVFNVNSIIILLIILDSRKLKVISLSHRSQTIHRLSSSSHSIPQWKHIQLSASSFTLAAVDYFAILSLGASFSLFRRESILFPGVTFGPRNFLCLEFSAPRCRFKGDKQLSFKTFDELDRFSFFLLSPGSRFNTYSGLKGTIHRHENHSVDFLILN